MTTPLTPANLTPNVQGSSTEPTGSAPAPAPTPEPAVWRAPAGAPAWAQGKTAEQILEIATQAVPIIERFNQQSQVPAAQPVQTSQAPTFADEDFLTGAQVRALLDQREQSLRPILQQATQQGASVTVGMAMMKHKDAFDKWGPEINAMMAGVPRENLTVDMVGQIVNIVRSNHVDEIVREQVAAAAQNPPTLRSNGAATGAPTQTQAGLNTAPEPWQLKAKAAGISDREIEDFCRVNEMTTEQFFKQFDKGNFMAVAVSENRFRPVLR